MTKSPFGLGAMLSALQVSSQIVGFMVVNQVAKALGLAEMGSLSVLQFEFIIISSLADLGLSGILLARARQSQHLETFIRDAGALRLVLAVGALVLYPIYLLVFRWNSNLLLPGLILALGLLFNPGSLEWIWMVRSNRTRLAVSRAMQLLGYAFAVPLASFFANDSVSLLHICFWIAVSGVPSMAMALVSVKWQGWQWLHWKAFAKPLVHEGAWMAIAGWVGFLYLPLGLFVVERMADPDWLGAYATAHKLAYALQLLIIQFMVAWMAQGSGNERHGGKAGLQMLALGSSGLALLAFLAPQLISSAFYNVNWTAPHLNFAVFSFRLLLVSLFLQLLRMVHVVRWIEQGRVRLYTWIALAGGALNLILCAVLLPQIGFQYTALCILAGDVLMFFALRALKS